MKKIKINGQEFEYMLFSDVDGDSLSYYWTEFYQGTEIKTRKKYLFFGEKIFEVVPKKVFELRMDIEDHRFTKAQVREKIERQIELMNRKEEIERGEIV